MQLLILRFIALAESLEQEEEAREGLAAFRAFQAKHFAAAEPALPLLGLRTVTLQGALDFLICAVVNSAAMDTDLYQLMYWTTFMLMYARKKDGRRLTKAMEAGGFVFADDVRGAVQTMKTQKRNTSVWAKIEDHVDQLCAALTQPAERTVAGVFNNMIKKCSLPVAPVLVCTKKELRQHIVTFFENPLYKEGIRQYVKQSMGGNRRRSILVKTDDDEGTVMVYLREPETGPSPVFASKETCVNFLLDCATSLFLPEKRRSAAAVYMKAYRLI